MINTNKLLPTTSGKSKSLIENLTVIKKDVVKINSLLKERLVLSKVRYAILKQNEERKRRQDRESLLEIRKETRSQSVTPSKKKKKRGLLSNLLGGVFKIFTSGTFKFIPLLLGFAKKIALAIGPFTLITSGVILAVGKVLDSVQDAANKARGVNKKDIDSNTLEGTIGEFGNSILTLSTVLLGNILTQRAINRALNRNRMSEAELIDQLTLMGRQKRAQRSAGRTFVGRPTTMEEYLDFQDFEQRRRVTTTRPDYNVKPSSLGAMSDMQDDLSDIIKKGSPEEKARVTRMFLNLDEDTPPAATSGGKSKGSKPVRVSRSRLTGDIMVGLNPDIKAEEELLNKILTREQQLDLFRKDSQMIENERREIRESMMEDNIEQQRRRSAQGEGMSGTRRRGTKNVRKGRLGTTSFRIEAPDGTVLYRAGGLTTADKIKNQSIEGSLAKVARKGKVFRRGLGKATGRGLLKFLGKNQVKVLRKFINNSIGVIPFLGDFIGLLLDIFLFGEPPGRAAFMAVGGLLGSFLGVFAGGLLGPIGSVVGGILGGIGGDIIGGFAYDLFFGRNTRFGQQFGKSMTKKGLLKGGLYTGGEATFGKYLLGERGPEYVIDSDSYLALEKEAPGFLAALNDADAGEVSEVLRTYASYEGPAGRERIVPVPIPQKEEVGSQQIMIMESPSSTTSSPFSQHYRRG